MPCSIAATVCVRAHPVSNHKTTIKDIENSLNAARIIIATFDDRMSAFDREQKELDARRVQAKKDFELAPKMLADAKIALAKAKLDHRKSQQTSGGAPLRREPKTKLEKKLEKRAKMLRELGRLEAEIETEKK